MVYSSNLEITSPNIIYTKPLLLDDKKWNLFYTSQNIWINYSKFNLLRILAVTPNKIKAY